MAGRKFEEESPEVGSGQMVSVSMHVRNERVGGITQSWGSDQSLGIQFLCLYKPALGWWYVKPGDSHWIQSRAYGLNIEFHIELRFKKKRCFVSLTLTVVAAVAQPVVMESSILGKGEAWLESCL